MRTLVPVDFSEVSLRALRVARLIEGPRTLLHVVPQPDARPQLAFMSLDPERRVKEARESLEALVAEGEEALVRLGKPHEVILELLKDYDIAVMGTHGAGGLAGMVGSVTLRVLREAEAPVLTVRHLVPPDLSVAVAGVDGSQTSEWAAEEASKIASKVVRVWVDAGEGEPPEGAKVISGVGVVKGLLEAAEAEGARFIAVGTRGLGGLRPILGSVTSGLLSVSQLPVLVVNG